MLMASTRPEGARLTRRSTIKVRSQEQVPTIGQGAGWVGLWNEFNQAYLRAQLEAMKDMGANCVKTATASNSEADIPDLTFRPRLEWFWDQCRDLDLKAYIAIQGGGQFMVDPSARIPYQAKVMGWLQADAADVVIGLDLANEINYPNQVIWGCPGGGLATDPAQATIDFLPFMAAARDACSFPLSVSVLTSNAGQYGSNGWLDVQYDIGCDFHDHHPYYQNVSYSPTGPVPAGADLVALEARPKYIGRHFIGEIGIGVNAGDDLQRRWFAGIGEMSQRPQSLGAVQFCLTDYETTTLYGAYDANFLNPRPSVIEPFADWPGSL